MNPLELEGEVTIEINHADRWQVYLRLQELDIPCHCSTNQPLRVKVNSPTAALQLWSVVRQVNYSRPHLVKWLTLCWQQSQK